MKVYEVKYCDYDEDYTKAIFKDEIEAAIYKEENDKDNDNCLFIEEYDLIEGKYDTSKYKTFTYYKLYYKPFSKYPIESLNRCIGIEDITDKLFITSINDISLYDEDAIAFIKADSDEEAESKFYDIYEKVINTHYKKENITRQNGKIKTWKRPKKEANNNGN